MNREPRRLGKYELRQYLDQGGFGEVWKAFDPGLQRYVAIKLLLANWQSPDFIARFEREARLIAALRHDNIVRIHEFQAPDAESTTGYMVMDYIEGGSTLDGYIRDTSRKGRFPDAEDLIYIFTEVSLAIDYAHQQGMLHRDIKPANILLDKRSTTARAMGKPILTDFGLAKLQGASTNTTRVTGHPYGSAYYASPEQAQGLACDKRSDLYSLGIILYEMTTGVKPFRGETTMAIFMQHYLKMPPPPASINPSIPAALSEIILKSIAKDPDARFQSASAMTIALAQALNVPIPPEMRKRGPSPDLPRIEQSLGPPPQPIIPPSPVSTASTNDSTSPSILPVEDRIRTARSSKPVEAIIPQPQVAAPFTPLPLAARQPIMRMNSLTIGLIALLVIVIGATVLYALPALKGASPPSTTSQAVGHIQFLSSPQALLGTPDEVQIKFLHPLPPADSNMIYYAWLVSGVTVSDSWLWDGMSSTPHPLPSGKNLRSVDFFLITKEGPGFNGLPTTRTQDQLYYAMISLTKSPFDIIPCPHSSFDYTCSRL